MVVLCISIQAEKASENLHAHTYSRQIIHTQGNPVYTPAMHISCLEEYAWISTGFPIVLIPEYVNCIYIVAGTHTCTFLLS